MKKYLCLSGGFSCDEAWGDADRRHVCRQAFVLDGEVRIAACTNGTDLLSVKTKLRKP